MCFAARGLSLVRKRIYRCSGLSRGERSLQFSDAQAQLSGQLDAGLAGRGRNRLRGQPAHPQSPLVAPGLPFAVEELLAEDVELMHLALGEQLADGRHRVFAVRRSWLAGWLALCTTPPQAIAVDADLLPGPWHGALALHGRWLLGGENVTRMACRRKDWPQLSPLCAQPQMPGVRLNSASPHPVDDSRVW